MNVPLRRIHTAQAAYWSAIHLHMAVKPRICEGLARPLLREHLEVAVALAVKADLLASGVAIDDHPVVQFEHDARGMYEASPWAHYREAADVIRPAPGADD